MDTVPSIDWNRVADQLAKAAVYGAIAQTSPPPLPKEFVHRLLDLVRESMADLTKFIEK